MKKSLWEAWSILKLVILLFDPGKIRQMKEEALLKSFRTDRVGVQDTEDVVSTGTALFSELSL